MFTWLTNRGESRFRTWKSFCGKGTGSGLEIRELACAAFQRMPFFAHEETSVGMNIPERHGAAVGEAAGQRRGVEARLAADDTILESLDLTPNLRTDPESAQRPRGG